MNGKTKLIVLIVKKILQLLAMSGLYGFYKTKDLRKRLMDLVVKVIPTEIDDAIIDYGKLADEEVSKLAEKLAKDIYSDFIDGTDIINAESDFINEVNNQKIKKFVDKIKYNRQLLKISAKGGVTPKDDDKDRGRFSGGRSLSKEERNARRKERREEGRRFIKEEILGQGKERKWKNQWERIQEAKEKGKKKEQSSGFP